MYGQGSYVVILDAAGAQVTSFGGAQYAEDDAHASGASGTMVLAVRQDAAVALAGTAGDYAPLEVDANGRLHVSASAGVAGDVAHAAADAGNPLKVGGVGKIANPTPVADGQRVNALFDKCGKQIAVGAVRELKGKQQTTIASSIAETTIITAVAGVFLDLYGLILSNTSALATTVTLRDDTAGAVLGIFPLIVGGTLTLILAVDSAIPQTAQNKPWTAQCSIAVASIEITALYVKNL